ncbi:hypothetical protein I552_7046 [Mycobacterium xenopi 3993]|nr:hypothetical protein I552_7046 [Mycobacterium xenopi 3993]
MQRFVRRADAADYTAQATRRRRISYAVRRCPGSAGGLSPLALARLRWCAICYANGPNPSRLR